MNLYKIKCAESESYESPTSHWQLQPFFVVAPDTASAHMLGMTHGIKEMNRVNEKIDRTNAERREQQEGGNNMHPIIMMMGGQMGMPMGEIAHVKEFKVRSVILIQEDILVEGM